MSCKCGSDFASQATSRIAIESLVTVADEVGGWVKSWQSALELWAVIEPMAGREVYLSAQLQSRVDARILIRFQDSLTDTKQTAKYRVRFGNRLYNIKAIKNLADDLKTEGRAFQQLLCTEGEAA